MFVWPPDNCLGKTLAPKNFLKMLIVKKWNRSIKDIFLFLLFLNEFKSL